MHLLLEVEVGDHLRQIDILQGGVLLRERIYPCLRAILGELDAVLNRPYFCLCGVDVVEIRFEGIELATHGGGIACGEAVF